MEAPEEFIRGLFSPEGFPARWYCGEWTSFHGWFYIISSLLIWLAYFTIPGLLIYFVYNQKYVPYKPALLLFAAFIISCGGTHLIDAIIFWNPVYRLSAALLFITAIISWVTVVYLFKIIPKALEYKSPEQLQLIIDEKTAELVIANEMLQKKEAEFKSLVNHNPDIICRYSLNKKIEFINDYIKVISGKSPMEYIGKSIYDFGYPDDYMKSFNLSFEKSVGTKLPVIMEASPANGNLAQKHFHIVFVPILDPKGDVLHMITVSRDVTNEKNQSNLLKERLHEMETLSKRLIRKGQKLQDFAYIVSHNLRSPISGMNTLLEIYELEKGETARQEIIAHLNAVCKSLTDTVNDLTEIVEINQDQDNAYEDIQFEESLNKQMLSLAVQIGVSEAIIESDFKACPGVVYSKVYLDSILYNLLSNAIKYSSPKRKPLIKLRTFKENESVVLVCEDNGVGIDMDKFGDKIFGLHKTFHGNQDARGVGLFITKNQIESMGGSIDIRSEVEKGTIFTIHFNTGTHENH